MTVLLTRAAQDNPRIAAKLAAQGIDCLTWPLARVVLLPDAVDIPDGTDALIFTSANAVKSLLAAGLVPALPAICVGERTAEMARTAGINDVVTAGGTAGDIITLVQGLPLRQLLYLRAETVSRDLKAGLALSGITVHERIVYRAEPGGPPDSEVAEALDEGRISVVTIWSRQNATLLVEHMRENTHWHMGRTDLVAISENAAKPLGMAGFRRILTASRPDADAMVETICAALRQ